jgi:flagellar biogenesis protein FliO
MMSCNSSFERISLVVLVAKHSLMALIVSSWLVCAAGVAVADTTAPVSQGGVSTQVANYRSSLTFTSMRMLGGLLLCLGVFAVGIRYMKRHNLGTHSRPRRMEIRERMALSSKASLTLITIDSKEFLVATSSDSVSIIPTHTARLDLFATSLEEADEKEIFNA